MNLLRIPTGGGSFNGLCGVDHQAIKLTQSRGGFFTLQRFALKGVVNGFAKRIPHFLLLLALNRHALSFMLPALLQVLDRINVQHRLGAQRLRFFDHGFTPGNALGTCGFKRCVGSVHRGLPHGLNFGECFFA